MKKTNCAILTELEILSQGVDFKKYDLLSFTLALSGFSSKKKVFNWNVNVTVPCIIVNLVQ